MYNVEYIRILISFADGSIGIMSFITNSPRDGWRRDASTEEIEKEISKTSSAYISNKLPVKKWRIIKEEDIPKDREFRDAWMEKDGNIQYNIEKAKKIHLDNLRKQRTPLLEQKDKEWMKAIGQRKNSEADRIEKERQLLRDLPILEVEAAFTIEQLKLIKLRA